MQRLTQEQKLERLTKLVGAYVKYVREQKKAPSIATLHKELFNIHMDAAKAKLIRKTLEECVAYVEPDNKAKLYRDNRPMEELMPVVIKYYKKLGGPDLGIKIEKVPVVANLPKDKIVETPVVLELDYSKLSDEELANIGRAYQIERDRREENRINRDKLATILSVAEMSADELMAFIQEYK